MPHGDWVDCPTLPGRATCGAPNATGVVVGEADAMDNGAAPAAADVTPASGIRRGFLPGSKDMYKAFQEHVLTELKFWSQQLYASLPARRAVDGELEPGLEASGRPARATRWWRHKHSARGAR